MHRISFTVQETLFRLTRPRLTLTVSDMQHAKATHKLVMQNCRVLNYS